MKQLNNWQDMMNNIDSFFGDGFLNGFEQVFRNKDFPAMNIYQSDNELLCLFAIPGLDNMDDVDVFLDYNTMDIKGNINLRYRGFRLTDNELFEGSFQRTVDLPFPVKEDKINATYQNGLLIVHLHRLIPDDRPKQKVSIKKIEE